MRTRPSYKLIVYFFLLFIFCSNKLPAHTINYTMEVEQVSNVITYYIWLGFKHIIPMGLDHILFVLGLFLLDSRIKVVVAQASCFTLAHSITLILSSKDLIAPPLHFVEPVIALSIVFVALENVFSRKQQPWRYVIIFLFGLIHGMGFASALNEVGLPRNTFYTSLISFNIGIELGQLAVILIAYFLIGKWFSQRVWYRKRVVIPVSICIAFTATIWTFERVFLT